MADAQLSEVSLGGHPDWVRFENLLAKLTAGRMYWEDLRVENAPIDERSLPHWSFGRVGMAIP